MAFDELGIDVLNDRFFKFNAFSACKSFKELRILIDKLRVINNMGKKDNKMAEEERDLVYEIGAFFGNNDRIDYFGQLLTDFNNGIEFKNLLIGKGYNGYIFKESYTSPTYCVFDYSVLSEGAFDIAIEPLTSLWDFTAENPKVPKDSLIQAALPKCNYHNISVDTDKNEITLKTDDTAIELGAIAKGYIADRLKDYLVSQNVKSAIINLGGNVLCIGEKTDNSAFKIGIQKPFADRSETIAVMDIRDKSVVSSGIYERCFEQDGTLYHHLLNPKTGYPYDNGLIAVTIISDQSVDGDALSTTCFALGLEDGMKLAESLDDVQAFFVTSDYEIHYTRDFQKKIKVTETE